VVSIFWRKILTDNREDMIKISIPEEYLDPAEIKQNYNNFVLLNFAFGKIS